MTKLLDAKALAEHLSVSVRFVYERTAKSALDPIPHVKIGKFVRFDPAKVDAWLADHERAK